MVCCGNRKTVDNNFMTKVVGVVCLFKADWRQTQRICVKTTVCTTGSAKTHLHNTV